MRVPLSWLREFAPIPAGESGRAVAARLISAGLEVETVDILGAQVSGPLVVARVLSIEVLTEFKKPIRFCRVEVGVGNGESIAGEPSSQRGIICGAANFDAGDLVVVALPGSVLPGGFQIATRQTYGRTSDGMIVSERELGVGEDHGGIIVLPPGTAAPGASGYEVLGLGEEVLDIAVTPDRGYALSVRGVAREAATAYNVAFTDPALVDPEALLPEPSGEGVRSCTIVDPRAADRFVLRSLGGLDPLAMSPQWMRRRLIASGMRPVSLAVDVTNYVMLELGQPLHAFDSAKLTGPLSVRRAQPGEVLETLDHVKRKLSPADVLISDQTRPLALAGTMGGLDSEIDNRSHQVAIEAVHFDADEIARMSRRHKLSSEASRRFERGVDPGLPAIASARAAALLIEFGGATYSGTCVDEALRPQPVIVIRADLPARVSGMQISDEVCAARLIAIGADVHPNGPDLAVGPPSWRPDLTDPADLVEEVVRLGGYENLPATLPRARAGFGLTGKQRLRRRVGRTLAGCGLVEVLNYPFIAAGDLDALEIPADSARRALVRLANPLSEESPFLRSTLLPGLLATLKRNLSRGNSDIAIFEAGSVFHGTEVGTGLTTPRPSVAGRPTPAQLRELFALLPDQPLMLAACFTGTAQSGGWWGVGRDVDWSDAVGAVRDVARELGVGIVVEPAAVMPWHPGRCARILAGETSLGFAGELHPRVIANLGLPKRTCAFEVDLDALLDCAPATAQAPAFSTFPVAKEDLALVVANDVPAEAVRLALLEGGGDVMESVRLFDVYTGAQVGEGKSLAFSMRLRAKDRTLSSADVANARQGALAEALVRCGAKLRE